MCGIAGVVHWGTDNRSLERVEKMISAINHRGPDGKGIWDSQHCTFGHARLSILDLSGGIQPMTNEDGNVIVIFNGEIYNHRELRRELEKKGHVFKTDHSDTEVLVHGYESWGKDLPNKLNGMFAFAIWDQKKNSLFLARDRYGIKPLYVSYIGEKQLVFASEVRGILASGLVAKKESMYGVMQYFSFQNQWDEHTPFENIYQFPAGTWEFLLPEGKKRKEYWDYSFPRSSKLSLQDAADKHRDILKRVVSRQIDADVPVMAYLSGGIDSSSITAAAYNLDRNVRAYSCIFNLDGVGSDRASDEREFARAVVKHLDIEHVEMELAQDALKYNLDSTIRSLEYPRMGMSYENYIIAERVAQDAKVVLSGMGGDEIHGGYLYRYQLVRNAPTAKRGLKSLLKFWHKEDNNSAKDVYRQILNFPIAEANKNTFLTPEFISKTKDFSPREIIDGMFKKCPSDDLWDLVMYIDAKTYMHGLLVLEDKLSMAHSLETRVPLLDNELVDYILDLPWSMLCDGNTGKIVFRESVKPWVPDEIYKKPKMGFGPPDASWYRGTLRGWIEEELSEKKIKARGVFQPLFVRKILDDHFNEKSNNVSFIWSLLSFESWCRVYDMFGGEM